MHTPTRTSAGALLALALFCFASSAAAQCTEGCIANVLVWDNDRGRTLCYPDAEEGCLVVGTEQALVDGLIAAGALVTVMDTLPDYLGAYDAIYITLGWRKDGDPAGQITPEEDFNLHCFLVAAPRGSIFLQGNDFALDHPTSYLLADFGAVLRSDGDPKETGNLESLKGIPGTITAGMTFPYQFQAGPDNFPDDIIPGGPTPGTVILDDPRGMGFPTETGSPPESPGELGTHSGGRGASIFLSCIMSAFEDGDPPSTKYDFLQRTLEYFGFLSSVPPVFEPPTPANGSDLTVAIGSTLTFPLQAIDPDGDFVTIQAGTLPANAVLQDVVPGSPGTATFTWLPLPGQVGEYTVTFTATDGVSSSQTSVRIVVEGGEIDARLDIRPGGCPNPLSVSAIGVLPVALLGTPTMNVQTVDLSSLRLEGVAPTKHGLEDVATPPAETQACACTDAGADGRPDLTLKFPVEAIIAALGGPAALQDREVRELSLVGQFMDGTPFEARDCVRIQKGRKDAGAEATNEVTLEPAEQSGGTRRIAFTLPAAGDVTLFAYDVRGRLAERILTGRREPGEHVVEWSPWRLPAGTYFLRLEALGAARVERVVVAH